MPLAISVYIRRVMVGRTRFPFWLGCGREFQTVWKCLGGGGSYRAGGGAATLPGVTAGAGCAHHGPAEAEQLSSVLASSHIPVPGVVLQGLSLWMPLQLSYFISELI